MLYPALLPTLLTYTLSQRQRVSPTMQAFILSPRYCTRRSGPCPVNLRPINLGLGSAHASTYGQPITQLYQSFMILPPSITLSPPFPGYKKGQPSLLEHFPGDFTYMTPQHFLSTTPISRHTSNESVHWHGTRMSLLQDSGIRW